MGLENKNVFLFTALGLGVYLTSVFYARKRGSPCFARLAVLAQWRWTLSPTFFGLGQRVFLANTHHGQLQENSCKRQCHNNANNANNFINSVATQGSVWFYLWPSDRHSQEALDPTCDPCFASWILCPPLMENNENHSDPPKSLHKTEVSRHQRSLIWFPSGNN